MAPSADDRVNHFVQQRVAYFPIRSVKRHIDQQQALVKFAPTARLSFER
jgi:hypothetical protein